jgi:hypothetical protein
LVNSPSFTPNCSTTIFFTRASTVLITIISPKSIIQKHSVRSLFENHQVAS